MPGSAGAGDWGGVDPLVRGPAIRAGVGGGEQLGWFAGAGLGVAGRHTRRRVQHLALRGPTTPPVSFTVAARWTDSDRQGISWSAPVDTTRRRRRKRRCDSGRATNPVRNLAHGFPRMPCCFQPIALRRSSARGIPMDEFRIELLPIPMYEPPARPYVPDEPWVPLPASQEALPCRSRVRPRTASPTHREPAGIRRAACSAARSNHGGEALEQARLAAERSLRVALEVLDHRRPVSQLSGIADERTVAAVGTLVRADLAPSRELGSAVLAGLHVEMIDEQTAEICARYLRGSRRLALAARIERSGSRDWHLTALRLS